jgi:pilus assembly protein Flp/PilA
MMKTKIRKFFREEAGASAVEYGLLVALIAVAILGAVSALGTGLSDTFTSAKNSLSTSS